MKITIKDKEIELKYSIRALIMFENVAENAYTGASITQVLTLMYCIILTSAKDYTLDWNEYLDWIDENPNIMTDFATWLVDVQKNQNKLKKD